jgi:hypothetical protein
VLAKNLEIFNNALLGAVLTTRVENGDLVLRADLLERTKTPVRSFVGMTPASSFVGMTPASSHEAAHDIPQTPPPADYDIPQPASAKEFTADKGLYAAAALGGLLALAGGARWLATQGLH